MTRRTRLSVLAGLIAIIGIGCTSLKRLAYEGPGRDDWQQPERVIQALELEPGQFVADVGSGGGYFTFRLAAATGPDGTVYAVDIDRGLNDYVRKRAAREGLENVVVIQAAPDDPRIPAGGVDLIFTCNTYHHIDDRVAYFTRARRSLREGGRVAIIDYHDRHGASPASVIRSEMEAAGYRLERQHDFLARQSFLVFATAGGAPE
jgi:ubiquinone/menaquinone biosynthesis C-methylase UbiE